MTIIYVLGALLVGWVIGFLDSNMRSSKKIKSAEANAEIKINEAERKIALASQGSQVKQDTPGLLRLKNENGRYIVEIDGIRRLRRVFSVDNFAQALAFVNKVGAVAEAEGHHPDLYLAWGKCGIEIWTHKINGLTESDFVFAALYSSATVEW